jgi:hypothetical protein
MGRRWLLSCSENNGSLWPSSTIRAASESAAGLAAWGSSGKYRVGDWLSVAHTCGCFACMCRFLSQVAYIAKRARRRRHHVLVLRMDVARKSTAKNAGRGTDGQAGVEFFAPSPADGEALVAWVVLCGSGWRRHAVQCRRHPGKRVLRRTQIGDNQI